jgi:hypothetical protein
VKVILVSGSNALPPTPNEALDTNDDTSRDTLRHVAFQYTLDTVVLYFGVVPCTVNEYESVFSGVVWLDETDAAKETVVQYIYWRAQQKRAHDLLILDMI